MTNITGRCLRHLWNQLAGAVGVGYRFNSGALWQGSNSKIEYYGFSAAVALFEKVLQSFLACGHN